MGNSWAEGELGLMCVLAQWRPTLCSPVDCSPTGSPVYGISQAGILESINGSRLTDRAHPVHTHKFWGAAKITFLNVLNLLLCLKNYIIPHSLYLLRVPGILA